MPGNVQKVTEGRFDALRVWHVNGIVKVKLIRPFSLCRWDHVDLNMCIMAVRFMNDCLCDDTSYGFM